MKPRFLALASTVLLVSPAVGQFPSDFFEPVLLEGFGPARILFATAGTPPTRIGSLDGPLAGANIWGQLLVGLDSGSLLPVGVPVRHRESGWLVGGTLTLEGIPCNSLGYAQLVVWDDLLWGSSLSQVPIDQLGRTDIVAVGLGCPLQPALAPRFTLPAIVPVPEPSVLALAGLGVVFVLGQRHWRRSGWP